MTISYSKDTSLAGIAVGFRAIIQLLEELGLNALMHAGAPQGAPEWVSVHWLFQQERRCPARKGASHWPPLRLGTSRGAAMEIGAVEKGKLGELYVFSKLIEKGAMPFLPIADTHGIDAVIRKKDGTHLDIQIKVRESGWFDIWGSEPRDNLFFVGVIMVKEPPEVWIFPSEVYAQYATKITSKGYPFYRLGLDSGIRKHGMELQDKLREYCGAWHLLTG